MVFKFEFLAKTQSTAKVAKNFNSMVDAQTEISKRENTRFLITGAHGFIGAWVAKRLLEFNARVILFDQSADPRRLRLIMSDKEIARAPVIIGDITDPDAIAPVLDKYGVSHIIHLAGLQVPTCRTNPRQGALVNILGTINVFEAARERKESIQSIVYASSAAVFGM